MKSAAEIIAFNFKGIASPSAQRSPREMLSNKSAPDEAIFII